MVVAVVALVMALGGTSYAAFKLPKASVGSRELKTGAVSSAKVRDRTLRAKDFAAGQLPVGPKGQAGEPGAKGDAGPKGEPGAKGDAGPNGETGAKGATGANGAAGAAGAQGVQGPPGPTVSGYAQNQNHFVFVNSAVSDTVSVALTGSGGTGALSVGFKARLLITGSVNLRNNGGGTGDYDHSRCRPQVSANGGAFADAGPENYVVVDGHSSFSEEASVPITGSADVLAGSFDVRIVCRRYATSGPPDQNKFDGDPLSVVAVAR